MLCVDLKHRNSLVADLSMHIRGVSQNLGMTAYFFYERETNKQTQKTLHFDRGLFVSYSPDPWPCTTSHLVPPAFQGCKWLIFPQLLQNLVHGLWPLRIGVETAVNRHSATMRSKHIGKTAQDGSYLRLQPSNLFPFHFKSYTTVQSWSCRSTNLRRLCINSCESVNGQSICCIG